MEMGKQPRGLSIGLKRMVKGSKVSIVLPTYNGASKFIQQSIDSCINQTYTNWELIVIDDCSKDDTPSVVKSYNDPRIRYIRNATNQRLPKALNIGFAASSGDYLTWTSDDNFYLDTAIEKMVGALQNKSCEFVYADIYELQGSDIPGARAVSLNESDQLKNRNCIRACFLYSRKVLETVGEYDPDMELIEDYDYWVRVSSHFYMHHLKEPLYYYRYHPESLWCSKNEEIRVIEFLFKLKYDFLPIDDINWLLREKVIQKSENLRLLRKFSVNLIYKNKIQSVLEQFKSGKITFTNARLQLHKMING
jgi:glycosyltransferase involved in cell wall biosynthesis